MAEKLGRTVGELLFGSGGHRPISGAELTEWEALWRIRAWEHEQELKKAKARR